MNDEFINKYLHEYLQGVYFFAQRRSLPNQQYAVDIKSPFKFRVKCHPKIIG